MADCFLNIFKKQNNQKFKKRQKKPLSEDSNSHPLEHSNSITFGYSSTEDRIWVRLLLISKSEVRFWISRRLSKAVYDGMAGLLTKSKVIDGKELDQLALELHLKAEFFELSLSTFDPAPPPPVINKGYDDEIQVPKSAEFIGLCHSITLTSGDKWLMRFNTNKIDYQLALERRSMLKVFIGLLKTSANAGWDIPNTYSWIYF